MRFSDILRVGVTDWEAFSLSEGILSRDSLNPVFSLQDPVEVQARFSNWVKLIASVTVVDVVANKAKSLLV